MKKLQLQAFFDNTRGHEKQTRAILEALENITPLKVSEVTISNRSVKTLFRYLFHLISSVFSSPKVPSSPEVPDLVIGTGSNCHMPMLLAASQDPSTRAVTCMTPEKFLLPKFDLCLVPAHDKVRDRKNVFRTIGPPCPVYDKKMHKEGKGLILIGGIDHKSHFWQTSLIVDQVKKIIGTTGITWIISSSPRTPDNTSEALERLCANNEHVEFFRAEETPDGWVEGQYDNSSMVWVTADSISMVYEALSAGCKVGILPVKWKGQDNKFMRSLTALSEKKLIIYLADWLKGHPFPEQERSFNEATRCAKEIIKKWWPDRL